MTARRVPQIKIYTQGTWLLVSCVAAWGSGCGAGATSPSTPAHTAQPVEREGQRALAAQAALARARANSESTAAASLDHQTRARLLEDAAAVEAQRAALDVENQALLREVAALSSEVNSGRALLADSIRQRQRARVAQLLRHASEQAFEVAARGRRRRRLEEGREARLSEAAGALRGQAELIVAALRSLDAPAAIQDDVRATIARSTRASDAETALVLAEDAIRRGYRALRNTRAALPGPANANAIREALADAGLSVEQRRMGLSVALDGLFHPRTSRLRGIARERLERLAAILAGLFDGPLELRTSQAGLSPRLREGRHSALASILEGGGVEPGRIAPSAGNRALAQSHEATILLPGVGPVDDDSP